MRRRASGASSTPSTSPSAAPTCSRLADLPDNEAAAALALAVTAGGGAAVRTIVLMSPEEIDAATKQVVKYTPPGG